MSQNSGPRQQSAEKHVKEIRWRRELGLEPKSWSGRDAKFWAQFSSERSARCPAPPKKKMPEEQIVFALCQAAPRTPVGAICWRLNLSIASLDRWKKVYAGIGVAEIRRLKQLGDVSAKLRRLVANRTLYEIMLQDALPKMVKPVRRREVAQHF